MITIRVAAWHVSYTEARSVVKLNFSRLGFKSQDIAWIRERSSLFARCRWSEVQYSWKYQVRLVQLSMILVIWLRLRLREPAIIRRKHLNSLWIHRSHFSYTARLVTCARVENSSPTIFT